MISYFLKRLAVAVPTLLILIVVSYVLMYAAPGGPFDTERALPPEVMANLERKYGLDRPLVVQVWRYLVSIVTEFDFGPLFRYKDQTVNEIIRQGFPVTLTYGAWSFGVAVLVGVSLGIAAAVHHNSVLDHLAVGVSIGAQVLPNFVMEPILTLVFTLWLGWLPGGGWQGGQWPYVVMPVIALSTSFMASIARITRASMLEVLNAGFIRTARAKGLPRRQIVFRHALKPAMLGSVAEKGAPSLANGHYFGVDELGRDLFARTVQGTRISLMVGIVGAFISVVVGTLYGATAGYIGGRLDSVMMRIVDVLMAIPYMFVLILFMVVFGRSILMLFVGIGLIRWLDMARIARGQTLSIRNREFIEAAVAMGVRPGRIILRHVVPNLLGVVIVYATLLVPSMIIYESFISFLGLGVQEPATSWGALINAGASRMQYGTLWQLLFPLFFFVVTLFSFFFLGDGLRDALDPRDR